MNTLGRDNRPLVKHGLHMYRALLTGIHLMRTGDLEPHSPTPDLETGLEHVVAAGTPGEERSPRVMG